MPLVPAFALGPMAPFYAWRQLGMAVGGSAFVHQFVNDQANGPGGVGSGGAVAPSTGGDGQGGAGSAACSSGCEGVVREAGATSAADSDAASATL